jgi:hypothetical protein
MIELGSEELKKIERLQYENLLNRYLKKDRIEVLSTNVRGASIQLSQDMRILALDKIDKDLGKDTLLRLHDICKYFVAQKSERRKSYDNNPNRFKYDKFSRYEEQLEKVEHLLENFN